MMVSLAVLGWQRWGWLLAPARSLTGTGDMPINRLLIATAFDPAQVREVVEAYEGVLADLNLVDRTDPITELIARTIIDCAKAGEFDRKKLHDCALAALTSKGSAA